MKFNLKKGIVFSLLLLAVIPFIASGEEVTSPTINSTPENFCSQIGLINERLMGQIKIVEEKQALYQSTRLINIENLKSEEDATKAIARAETDGQRENNWEKMGGLAKTDEQKLAVNAYKESIQSAIVKRRDSVDNAIEVYRTGLLDTVKYHTEFVYNTLEDFKKLTWGAIKTAVIDCNNKETKEVVSLDFTKKIDQAKETIKIAKNEVEQNPKMALLKKNRDDAINLAESSFKTSIEDAHKALVESLKK